ncbi:hypothetical protein NQ317_010650 [Molorchus minor]|uniref:Uncharacterized protein n=1 Tax=Molorchus minor TaxID=1323400 RepID=A0ABQ9K6G1_9CUCU|nr:hypothetical protein NQ317_010650 [Molorchus minor]
MAEAGFVFIGNKLEPDTVKCFLCHKSLDGWDATDDPWKEHRQHAPKCLFAKLSKPQESLTVRELLDIKNELTSQAIIKFFDNKAATIKEEYNENNDHLISLMESLS